MAVNKNKALAAAQRYVQKGLLDRAIKEYMTIAESEPEDVRTWLKIGDLYSRKGSIAQAVNTFERVAQVYEKKGFFLKAVAVYKQILDVDPTLIDMHRRLGHVYVKLNLMQEAIGQFQLVVGSLERDNRHQDSIQLLREMVELVPGDEANHLRLAEAYARDCENESAISEFMIVLEGMRKDARHADFIKVAERVLYLYPDEHDITLRLAESYLARRKPRRALSWLQVLFKADPVNPNTLELLGRTFLQIDKKERALSVYREVVRICGEQNDHKRLIRAHEKILEINPNDAASRSALERLSQGENKQPSIISSSVAMGMESVSEAMMSVDDRIDLCLADVELLVKYDLSDHAEERLALANKLDPENIGVLIKAKDIAVGKQENDKAVKALLKLSAVLAGRDPEQAKNYLVEASRMDPTNESVRDRLAALQGGGQPSIQASQDNNRVPLARVKLQSVPASQAVQAQPSDPTDDWLSESVDLDDLNLDDIELDDLSLDEFGEDGGSSIDGSFELSLDGFEANEELGFEIDLGQLDGAPDDDEFGHLLSGDAGTDDDEFADLLTEDDVDDFPSSVSGSHVVIAPPPTRDDMDRLDVTHTQDSSIDFDGYNEVQVQLSGDDAADHTMEQTALNPDDFEGIDLDAAALEVLDQVDQEDDFGGLLVTEPDDEPETPLTPEQDKPEKKDE